MRRTIPNARTTHVGRSQRTTRVPEWAMMMDDIICVFITVMTETPFQVLEPVMLVEVNAPQEFQGAIMAGLSKRSAVILNADTNEGYFTIYCEVFGQFLHLHKIVEG